MGVNLKYDLSEYKSAVDEIKKLKSDIETSKEKMLKGLETIKSEWISDGSKAFFDSIDSDWETAVRNCINVLEDLTNALDKAYTEYMNIENDAETYLKI